MIMKKCAVINDLSGFGKCSLTASLPVISVMGIEVHPLPTAVLSNQTAYDSFKKVPLTAEMKDFIKEWQKLGASFDGILTGFVCSEEQLDIISDFIDCFKTENTIFVADPVMADNGNLYNGYTEKMCEKIKSLCFKADIITPNIAELALIAGEPYSERLDDIISYGAKLNECGIDKIVATGYKRGGKISNIVFDNGNYEIIASRLIGGYFSGTGDIISSIVMGAALKGMTLADSVRLASDFIEKSILSTKASSGNDGIDFEQFLEDLIV